jgi:hypothetical protein
MVHSGLDLGPNDLNIDLHRLEQLSKVCSYIWIGHQHKAEQPLPNVYIPGGTMEFNFGELGTKYVYVCETEGVSRIPIPQPREMKQITVDWEGPINFLDSFRGLSERCIYKIIVDGIQVEEYSAAKSAMDVLVSQFKGDIIYQLNKLGHEEIQVTEINASFDLLAEFEEFAELHDVPMIDDMRDRLNDAVSELLSEEED